MIKVCVIFDWVIFVVIGVEFCVDLLCFDFVWFDVGVVLCDCFNFGLIVVDLILYGLYEILIVFV